ncbi:hypothetical protein CU633_01845 [Bacillus sp. V3-13]|uniref:PH domain-containing protein n=1 Tax=Bacillus sp. V3-13 TaxID=2053728 RepID=UPI000C784DD4|nr:PH domain-containing protein [Bacillus sp. V3-13]PLR79134.1 hypothetical protein CU633_01845 [Bacillus sp. V3-13]
MAKKPNKHMKEALKMLREGEKVYGNVFCVNKGTLGELIITSLRVLFVGKSILSGTTVEEAGYEQISSVEYRARFGEADLKIYLTSSSHVISVNSHNYEGLQLVAKFINDTLRILKENETKMESEVKPEVDYVSQLERLVKLKEDGHISEEEFIEFKKNLRT